MASIVYDSFKKLLANHGIDMEKAPLKVALVAEHYEPDAAHSKRADVAEIGPGGGYEPGGLELTGKKVEHDTDMDAMVFRADGPVWEMSTITACGAVVYVDNGGALEDELVAYFDFGKEKASINGNFFVVWDAAGILNWSWW